MARSTGGIWQVVQRLKAVPVLDTGRSLGSGLILDHSQNRTVAAKAIAER